MKREIDGCVYDTANAEFIASHNSGTVHIHRTTSLYFSAEGSYFLVEEQEAHGVDGALLTPFTDAMAREWLESHGKTALARSMFKSGEFLLRIEVDADLLCQIDCAAEAAGLSEQAWVLAAINAALGGCPAAPAATAGRGATGPAGVTSPASPR